MMVALCRTVEIEGSLLREVATRWKWFGDQGEPSPKVCPIRPTSPLLKYCKSNSSCMAALTIGLVWGFEGAWRIILVAAGGN